MRHTHIYGYFPQLAFDYLNFAKFEQLEIFKIHDLRSVYQKRGAFLKFLELWEDADLGIAEVEKARKRLMELKK